MERTEQLRLLTELINHVKEDIIKESAVYPETWDGIELRWRVADAFSQVVFGEVGARKGKRYRDYRNTVIINDTYNPGFMAWNTAFE